MRRLRLGDLRVGLVLFGLRRGHPAPHQVVFLRRAGLRAAGCTAQHGLSEAGSKESRAGFGRLACYRYCFMNPLCHAFVIAKAPDLAVGSCTAHPRSCRESGLSLLPNSSGRASARPSSVPSTARLRPSRWPGHALVRRARVRLGSLSSAGGTRVAIYNPGLFFVCLLT